MTDTNQEPLPSLDEQRIARMPLPVQAVARAFAAVLARKVKGAE